MPRWRHLYPLVGYANTEVLNGSKILGMSFADINGDGGIYVSELAPVGYEDKTPFITSKGAQPAGVTGQFVIQILGSDGSVEIDEGGNERTYSFYRTYDKVNHVWQNNARWLNDKGTEIKGENDYFIKSGDAVWFVVTLAAFPTGTEQYSLNNAGEALLDSGDVELVNGSKTICAPLSAKCMVSQLKPLGYEDKTPFITSKGAQPAGVTGQFVVQFLDTDGSVKLDGNKQEMTYSFYRTYDKVNKVWQNNARWLNDGGIEISGKNDVEIPMGQGIWAVATLAAYPTGTEVYKLNFPGLSDDK